MSDTEQIIYGMANCGELIISEIVRTRQEIWICGVIGQERELFLVRVRDRSFDASRLRDVLTRQAIQQ